MRHGRARIGTGVLLVLLTLASTGRADDEAYRVLDLRKGSDPGEHAIVFCARDGEVDSAVVVLARQVGAASPREILAFGQHPRPNMLGLPAIHVGPVSPDDVTGLLKRPFAAGTHVLVCQVDADVWKAAEATRARWAGRSNETLSSRHCVGFLHEMAKSAGLTPEAGTQALGPREYLVCLLEGTRPSTSGVALELPRIATLGRAPEGAEAIVVSVTGDGRISLNGQGPLSLVGLRDMLQRLTADPMWREPDRSSRKSLVVNADASVPWIVVQWIVQVAAEPTVLLYRIFLGARPRSGERRGAIGWRLPKDRVPEGSFPGVVRPSRITVKVLSNEAPVSDPEELLPLLLQLRTQAGGGVATVFEVETPQPLGRGVETGFLLRVLDVAARAGFTDLRVQGAPASLGAGARDAAFVQRHVAELKARPGTPTIQLGAHVVPGAPSDDAPVSPGEGVLPRYYGFGIDASGRFEIQVGPAVMEELEEEDLEDDTDLPFENQTGIDTARDRATAIDDALKWLAAHQSPHGGWEATGFSMWCDGKPAEVRPEGPGKALYDPGVTGLALSAFLGAGYTNLGRHPFASTVSKGFRYLKNIQDREGCFGPRNHQHYIYCHAIASLAVVDVYGRTGSPIFLGSAQRALDFIALCRNPYFAWRYGVKPGDNDTSVTGWMTLVLDRARRINEDALDKGRSAPLRIDEEAFDGIRHWIDKMTDTTSGRTGYLQRGGPAERPMDLIDRFPGTKSESMTAVGMLARVVTGEDPESPIVRKGAKLLIRLPPIWNPSDGSIDMIYWYYATRAMARVGGDLQRAWNDKLEAALLDHQRTDTTYCLYRGSWDPLGPWGPDGGRVYATALLALCLE